MARILWDPSDSILEIRSIPLSRRPREDQNPRIWARAGKIRFDTVV